jgi:hypothetical protein
MFNQDDKTKKFVEQVKTLVNTGAEPTYKAIAEKIGWHSNSLSVTLKGGRNVPFDIYKKFLEIYKLGENEKPPSDDEGYKDRYIQLLEQQLHDRDRQLSELKLRMDSRTLEINQQIESLSKNLAAHDRVARLALGYCKFLYQRWGPVEYRLNQLLESHTVKVPERQAQRDLKKVLDDLDRQLVLVLEAELISEKDN